MINQHPHLLTMPQALAAQFDLEARNAVEVKGKGRLRTGFLPGREPG